MPYFIKFFYQTFLLPPGIFIIILLFLSLWTIRRKRILAGVLFVVAILLYLSSILLISDALIRSLEARHIPPSSISGDVIIILGGGATLDTPNISGAGHLSGASANRVLTGAELYHLLKVPIILSGGQDYRGSGSEAQIARNILTSLGIPDSIIITEDESRNTSENVMNVKELIKKYGFRQPVLVTSAFHMERSIRQFKKVNQPVIPYPTGYLVNIHSQFEPYQLWPNAEATVKMQMALKEYLGIIASAWY
jgi:uncharacterized SAM-binding protein YcdF (DUF218 family)